MLLSRAPIGTNQKEFSVGNMQAPEPCGITEETERDCKVMDSKMKGPDSIHDLNGMCHNKNNFDGHVDAELRTNLHIIVESDVDKCNFHLNCEIGAEKEVNLPQINGNEQIRRFLQSDPDISVPELASGGVKCEANNTMFKSHAKVLTTWIHVL